MHMTCLSDTRVGHISDTIRLYDRSVFATWVHVLWTTHFDRISLYIDDIDDDGSSVQNNYSDI